MKNRLCMFLWTLIPLAALAHDTWLVPSAFQTAKGAAVHVKLATGEAFPASEVAVEPERVARFTLETKSGRRIIEAYRVEGTFLVADVTPAAEGHAVVVAETKPRAFELEPKVFNEYLREEELKQVMEARKAKGQWDSPGRERYRKIAKTVLCVGDPKDRIYRKPDGLWLEIVPQNSPCKLRVGDRLTVRVLFEGRPLHGVAVAAGYEGVTGHHYPLWVRTPKSGKVAFTLDRPGLWFIRTLHMVPAKDDPEADWQSAFSTLTFEVTP
jgi:uncharacterized GH25 family protein